MDPLCFAHKPIPNGDSEAYQQQHQLLVNATTAKHIDLTTIIPLPGTTACSSNPCQYICLNKPGGYNCSCPDNLITSVRNGQVHCNCPPGTKMERDGECKTTSKSRLIIYVPKTYVP